jgi:transketolase
MSPERFLSTTEAMVASLRARASRDPSVVIVDAEVSERSVLEGFETEFPGKYLRAGMSEREAVLLASGLSLSGRNVFLNCQSALLVPRAYDAIRSAVAIPSLPVSFLLTHSGLTGGAEGAGDQIMEDMAFLRALPNVSILVPSDGFSATELAEGCSSTRVPVFFRLSALARPDLPRTAREDFNSGGASLVREGDGVTLCACGTMVHEAVKAADILSQQGIEADVIDCYSIKPLPAQVITASVRRTGCCVVAEEHNASGGLGGAVAELLGQTSPVPVKFVSVQDRFGQSGGAEELLEYYGLSFKEILSAASQAWNMRRR